MSIARGCISRTLGSNRWSTNGVRYHNVAKVCSLYFTALIVLFIVHIPASTTSFPELKLDNAEELAPILIAAWDCLDLSLHCCPSTPDKSRTNATESNNISERGHGAGEKWEEGDGSNEGRESRVRRKKWSSQDAFQNGLKIIFMGKRFAERSLECVHATRPFSTQRAVLPRAESCEDLPRNGVFASRQSRDGRDMTRKAFRDAVAVAVTIIHFTATISRPRHTDTRVNGG